MIPVYNELHFGTLPAPSLPSQFEAQETDSAFRFPDLLYLYMR